MENQIKKKQSKTTNGMQRKSKKKKKRKNKNEGSGGLIAGK